MRSRFLFAILLATGIVCPASYINAQENTLEAPADMKVKPYKESGFYTSNALDAAILSTATVNRPAKSNNLSTLRFSYFFNYGLNFNYDFSRHVGIYTGLGIKNIGFIDKIKDSTVKRRVYTLSAPLGIKFGNIKRRTYGFLGGGVDIALNYKEKGFVKRSNKDKFNEWFSERTQLVMPYVFAGVALDPGVTFKFQYYPVNFMNTSYTEFTAANIPYAPYAGYEVNLVLLSLGFDIHYSKKAAKSAPAEETPAL